MAVLLTLLALMGAMILWAYFNFPPSYANKRQVRIFNWSTVAVCGMLCFAWGLNAHMLFSSPAVEKYRAFFLWGGVLTIEIVFFFIFFLLRNFWIFRIRMPKRG